MKCVLVDVDGTLLSGSSSERAFITHLARSGMLGPRQLISALGYFARYWPRYRRHVAKNNKAYLDGLDIDVVQSVAADFAATMLQPRLRPAMLTRLASHHQQGHVIALLTGTPDFIAAPLARLVGADAISASLCATQAGRFTAAPPLTHPFGVDKIIAANTLCAQLGCELRYSVAYADSYHDAALLDAVAHAVAVHPDAALEALARQAGWEILRDDATHEWNPHPPRN